MLTLAKMVTQHSASNNCYLKSLSRETLEFLITRKTSRGPIFPHDTVGHGRIHFCQGTRCPTNNVIAMAKDDSSIK